MYYLFLSCESLFSAENFYFLVCCLTIFLICSSIVPIYCKVTTTNLYAIQLIAPFLLVKYFSCGLVSLPWFLLSCFFLFLYICFLVYYVHTCIHGCDLNLLYLQCFLLLESNESRWSEFLQETDGSPHLGNLKRVPKILIIKVCGDQGSH